MSPVKRYMLWARSYWWMIGFIILLGILQFAGPLSLPLFTQTLIDDVLAGKSGPGLYETVGWMAAILFAGVAVNFARNYSSAILGNRMMMKLRRELYDHLQRMSVGFYEQRQVGALSSRVIHDIGGAQNLVGGGIINLVLDLLLVGFAAVLLFRMNAMLALISLAIMPFYYLSFTNMNVRIRLAWRAVHRQLERVSGTLVERMGGIRVVQAFNGEKLEKERFERQTKQHYKHTVAAMLYSNTLGRLSESFAHAGGLLIWLVGGGLVCADR
ncbi:hypothetical protein PACILC2_30950 [Paenibacillus cisolokensis]|uniref:ABC transmembrane type-1 domain-containing protein n=1 Tax=Paenibacillus cisolokensis TaxID=1658519 RepID=A0ABQ4N8K5_9BACL|nr:ABC transporter ATP-binding protein [Paenibacillus cisolokensis]GIQ64527.1 hypothetical protein PACILC2_30950 [Paenibacillus cisolokensis]